MRRTLAQSRLGRRLLAALGRFDADDLGTMAAALAFQAFLSLFPLMLLALSVAGFLLAGDPAEWLRRFFDAVPGIGPLVDRNLDAVIEARSGLGLVALGGVAWAASGLMGRTSDALGRIFRTPRALRSACRAARGGGRRLAHLTTLGARGARAGL